MKQTLAAQLERLSGTARAVALLLREPAYSRVRKIGGDRELFRLLAQPWLDRSRITAVLDVGANEGQAALTFRALFPHAEIHSFEPQPDPCRRLRERFAGDAHFHLHAIACGSATARLPMQVSEFSPASSLLKNCAPGDDASEVPTAAQTTTIEVPVERLDQYAPLQKLPPGTWLMKLDVQGFELEVLRGATGLLPKVEFIICEVLLADFYENQTKIEDVFSFLRSEGFLPIDFDDPIRAPKSRKVLYLDVAFAAQR